MNIRKLFVAALFVLALIPWSARAQDLPSGTNIRPDLYVRRIAGTPGSLNKLRVQVANKGNTDSLPCTLTITIYQSNAFDENALVEYMDVKVPAIGPGKGQWVLVEVEKEFEKSDAKNRVTPLLPFELKIDSKDDNPESNEKNNVARYRVPLRIPGKR